MKSKLKKNTFKNEFRKKLKNVKTFESFHPSQDPDEVVERMEGLSNVQDLENFKNTFNKLSMEWLEEGFETDDIINYVKYLLDNQ